MSDQELTELKQVDETAPLRTSTTSGPVSPRSKDYDDSSGPSYENNGNGSHAEASNSPEENGSKNGSNSGSPNSALGKVPEALAAGAAAIKEKLQGALSGEPVDESCPPSNDNDSMSAMTPSGVIVPLPVPDDPSSSEKNEQDPNLIKSPSRDGAAEKQEQQQKSLVTFAPLNKPADGGVNNEGETWPPKGGGFEGEEEQGMSNSTDKRERSVIGKSVRRDVDPFEGYKEEQLDQTIPIGFLEQKFMHYVRDGKLRRELFVFIPFLVLFLVFSLTDIDIEQGHMAIGALRKTYVEKFIPNFHVTEKRMWEQLLQGPVVQIGTSNQFASSVAIDMRGVMNVTGASIPPAYNLTNAAVTGVASATLDCTLSSGVVNGKVVTGTASCSATGSVNPVAVLVPNEEVEGTPAPDSGNTSNLEVTPTLTVPSTYNVPVASFAGAVSGATAGWFVAQINGSWDGMINCTVSATAAGTVAATVLTGSFTSAVNCAVMNGTHDANQADANAIQNDRVDMTFNDVESWDHWVDWLRMALTETFRCYNRTNPQQTGQVWYTTPNIDDLPAHSVNGSVRSIGLPTPFIGTLYPIGAMRIRTQRVKNSSCPIPSEMMVDQNDFPGRYNLVDKRCWASHKNQFEEKTSPLVNVSNPFYPDDPNQNLYRYFDASEVPGSWTTTDQGVYDASGYIVEVPFTASCAQVEQFLEVMENSPIIDNTATRFLTVEMFFYSASLDTHYSVKMIAEVTSGGAWIPTSQLRAFIVQSSSRILKTVLEFVFLIYVFYYIFVFFLNLKKFYHDEGRILRYFINFWTFIEMVNVVCYLAVFILRWVWWAESNKTKTKFPFSLEYPDMDTVLLYYSQMRYALAFNFILTFIKILKYLKMSGKLNVIALTFEKAQSDVIGLLLLFTMVVLAYALAGTSLFGPLMREFSSVDRSFSSLMQMLMGAMDYEAMKNVNRGLAGVYFWSYLVISFFLILNFIVAVISESFTQAGSEEFIPPLSESILMVFDEVIYTLTPKSLKSRFVLLFKHKKSTNFLHQQILTYISQLRMTKKLENPTALDIEVTARELIKSLPNNLRKEYQPFFSHEWKVVQLEYKLLAESDEEQLAQSRKVAIIDGVQRAMRVSNPNRAIPRAFDKANALQHLTDQVVTASMKKFDIKPEEMPAFASPQRRGRRRSSAIEVSIVTGNDGIGDAMELDNNVSGVYGRTPPTKPA